MNFVNSLMAIIETLGNWGYLIVFGMSFLEVVAFVGLLVPGTLFLIFVGFLTANGYLSFWLCLIIAVIGATVGDIVSFILGKKATKIFKSNSRIFYSKPFIRCQKFLDDHGGKGVFFGRFVGPIRPFISFVAGLGQMPAKKFFFWSSLGSVGWAFVYLGIGHFFGKSINLIGKWFVIIGTIVLIGLIALGVYLFIKHRKKKKV
jgi:membrane protein DedA with SNARE-associated domain